MLQGRERKATPTEAGGDRTVRCVLMNEQVFLNFRSKDDTQCFYFVLIFFSIDMIGVSTVIMGKLF